jgi:hypothetical protein
MILILNENSNFDEYELDNLIRISQSLINFYSFKNSVNSGRRSNQQQLMLSNYSYDPRLHLQPLSGLSKILSIQNQRIIIYKF